MRSYLLFCWVVSVLCSTCTTPQSFTTTRPANTVSPWQKIIDSTYANNKIPGILVGIMEKGKTEYYTAGFANVESKELFDKNSLFEAGSITKTFTAYILTSVLKQNSTPATASILPFLPDSVRQNTALSPVTFLSLLNHTSGLPRLPINLNSTVTDAAQPYQNYSHKELFNYLRTVEPENSGIYNYSNLGAGLAGVLAEIISGQKFSDLLQKEIFLPLRIVFQEKHATQTRSTGYWESRPTPFWDMNVLKAAGGLQCSAVTMMSYLSAMSNPPTATARTIIDTLTQPGVVVNDKISIGRGWHTLNKGKAVSFYWHNGGTYGFSTFVGFEKRSGNAALVVVNAFNKNDIGDQLGLRIMQKLIDLN